MHSLFYCERHVLRQKKWTDIDTYGQTHCTPATRQIDRYPRRKIKTDRNLRQTVKTDRNPRRKIKKDRIKF